MGNLIAVILALVVGLILGAAGEMITHECPTVEIRCNNEVLTIPADSISYIQLIEGGVYGEKPETLEDRMARTGQ